MKFIFYLLLALSCAADAGIAIVEGEVRDAETGRALDNVTVFFVGGVAKQRTDHNGRFSLEIDGKGVQSLLVQLDDFQTVIENLKMKAGQHSRLDIRISSTEKDGTVAISFRLVPLFSGEDVFASREMLEKLPVENVLQWLVLQPGFVQGHLRGGRADELNRQIDGFDVIDPFYFRSAAVMPELETLDGVSLKSGVSPAEFGGALGGTLAMHTQSEAARHFGRFGVRLGNYITSHDDKFIGLSSSDIDRNVDFRATAGGPIGGDKFGYLANLRYQHNNNHLNGIRRFFVDDYSDFSSSNPEQWYSEHNGDKTFIPMNNEIRLSALGKLNFRPGDRLKAELLFLLNQSQWRDYRHMFKYNPDGLPTSHHRAWMTGLSVDFKPARNINWQTRVAKTALYRGLYVFEDPSDAGYVHDGYLSDSGAGFYTGGQDKVHEKRTLDVLQVKTGLDWRLKGTHFLKAGIDYKQYTLDNEESDIVNRFSGTSKAQQRRFDSERRKMVYLNYDPLLDGDGEFYTFEPLEISAFMQDRIELENMVLEAGVRFEQFESGGFYPSDYSDPANMTVFGNSVQKKAKAKTRTSPRVAAVFSPQNTTRIRLAYGHFYQMPSFYALYADPDYVGAYSTYSNVLGNTDLEPQKKIEYEAGVQHEMSAFLNLRMTIFSREYSDLLGIREERTVNKSVYGVFENNESAISRGVEIGVDYQKSAFYAMLNYTLMTVKANLDPPSGPSTSYSDWQNRSDQRLFPMRWDQRHTINFIAGFKTETLGAALGLYYNSGKRYSPEGLSTLSNPYLTMDPNSGVQPSTVTADLYAWYRFVRFKGIELRFTLLSYNIFDKLNELSVYNDSGRAYERSVDSENLAGHHSDFNDYYDRIKNPGMFAAPRLVKIGLEMLY